METLFTWKTRLFSNLFQIFRDDMKVGELNKKRFSWSATGELNGKAYVFDTKNMGFFKHETEILSVPDNSVLGRITYSKWNRKAIIQIQNKDYNWQFVNFFGKTWSISDDIGVCVKYRSMFFKGEIVSESDNMILILAGIYIRNYYIERTAMIAAST